MSTNYDALIRAAGNATASDYGSEGATIAAAWDWLACRISEGARTHYWIALTAALLAGVGAL